MDGVPWNWPGRLQQRGSRWIAKQQCASAGRRLRACRAMPASQASSRTTPACLWAVAVPPSSTGHELGTLHPRAVGWSVAVQGARSTSVVVVSLDEAVQCSARACSEVTSCQPNAAPQPLEAAVVSHTRSHPTTQASDGGMSRRASAPWRMCRGEESGAAAVQWWLACVACWKEARLALPYGVRRRPGGAIWFGLGVTVGDAAN